MSVTAGFNQDEQGYLVAGGWSGTESKRRHHPHKPRPVSPEATETRYQVEYKTTGLLKRPESDKWVPYSTRSLALFTPQETTIQGGMYQFLRGGCIFRVDPRQVRVVHLRIEEAGHT